MHDGPDVPDLSFPTLEYGKYESPWTLRPLLYVGGAKAHSRAVDEMISNGKLGQPLPERVDLVKGIHEVIHGRLVGGGSMPYAETNIRQMRLFFSFMDNLGRPLSLEAVEAAYLQWTEALYQRVHVEKTLKKISAYTMALNVGGVIDEFLERHSPIIGQSRLKKPARRKTPQGVKAEKQNLQYSFEFGHLLQDICDGLTLDALWGSLPVILPLRKGGKLEEWSGLVSAESRVVALRNSRNRRYLAKLSDENRAAWEADRTLRTRYPLVNLRIEAEMQMFMAQTGMNLAQAHLLKLRNFSYASDINGWRIKERKNRRGGEVLFEIFREYRAHFERYLNWRRSIFPDAEELLFPLIRRGGRSDHKAPRFTRIQSTCGKLGISWVSPSSLRNTRVNWLLRRSGDPDLIAEMDQHLKQTLHTDYETPSLQRALGETMRFWSQTDPTIARTIATAPGECVGTPEPVLSIPKDATHPDCVHPSGCLWCEHHRDVDSFDYVWALTCFRHLKIIEVGKYHPPEKSLRNHPGELSITRISEKLHWFKETNIVRMAWVEESLARVEEGNYHPDWIRPIVDIEGSIE